MQVPSALRSLTSVFGMRTGGPPRHYHRNGIITRSLLELSKKILTKFYNFVKYYFAHWQLHIILE